MKKIALVVRKSQLPGAGKGLFTKEPIAKGSIIIEYKGHITTWKKVAEGDVFNGYVYYVSKNHVVNAMNYKKALARYANDAQGLVKIPGVRNNSIYITRKKRVFIQAARDIPAGAEILVPYGKEYWDTVRYNMRMEARHRAGKM